MRYYLSTLYPFQGRLVAYSCLRLGNLVVADQGLGKSHVAMATMGLLFEDDKIDHVVLICEQNKIGEWVADLKQFTTLPFSLYYGPSRKINQMAKVTLSTYRTWSTDLVDVDPDDPKTCFATDLLDSFFGKRVLVIYDEMALLGTSRTSVQYRANEMALTRWREKAETRVLGLTGTPMSTSPECFFNLGLLIKPEAMGTYKQFCDAHVTSFNKWDKPNHFRDLEGLERKLSSFMVRKRKTDPDVIDQFPKTVEKCIYLSMAPAHQRAYKSFEAWLDEQPEMKLLPAFQALNAFVCHPRSILVSGWELAQDWIEWYGGSEEIAKIPPVKAKKVIGYISSIARADTSGVIVFSNSVSALRALAVDIEALKGQDRFEFVEFHGGRTDKQNSDAKEAFRSGRCRVMLASSKAERGINLPEAGYVVNYGIPTTHSSYLQRAGRASRIGTNTDGIVVVKSFITRDTIERGTVNLWQARNEWSDRLQDIDAMGTDENFISAFARKAMLAAARKATEEEETDAA